MIQKILIVLLYGGMVTVNVLANALPINNRNTGQISDAYPNLFAPAGITFAIWGLIYLLLAGYVIHQFWPETTKPTAEKRESLQRINLLFGLSCILNAAWIFSWHYDFIWLSVLLMLALLITLIVINTIISHLALTKTEELWIALPFTVYFGWITVATIANVTVLLVSLGWDGFGLAEEFWTSVILLVGAGIGILRMQNDRRLAYGLVLIWAYSGILFKHLTFFAGKYPFVIGAVLLCILAFTGFVVRLGMRQKV